MVMLLQHQMKQHQQVHEELREINEMYQKSKVWLHGYHNCTYKRMQFRACHLSGMCICSAQSENLRNLEIALRILRILRLRSNLEIAQLISRLRNTRAQSRDRVSCMRNLRIST